METRNWMKMMARRLILLREHGALLRKRIVSLLSWTMTRKSWRDLYLRMTLRNRSEISADKITIET